MKISYYVIDPTGNVTVLVETPVPPADQPRVASLLMEREPETEQVGFLSGTETESAGQDQIPYDISLRMAGGEFCGNASMSAAVIAAERAERRRMSVTLRVSGAAGPVRAEVEADEEGNWTGTVEMPRPASVGMVDLPSAGPLPVVRFDGITHVIYEHKDRMIVRDEAEMLARKWCGYLDADALGIMFFDREEARLTPLVYVPAANTLCWENSCASGTTAVGACLAAGSERPLSLTLNQPGGSLTVRAGADGTLQIRGRVRVLGYKEAEF